MEFTAATLNLMKKMYMMRMELMMTLRQREPKEQDLLSRLGKSNSDGDMDFSLNLGLSDVNPTHSSAIFHGASRIHPQAGNNHRLLTGASATGNNHRLLTGASATSNNHGILTGASGTGNNHGPLAGASTTGNNHGLLTGASATGNNHGFLIGASSTGDTHGLLTGASSIGNNHGFLTGARATGNNHVSAFRSWGSSSSGHVTRNNNGNATEFIDFLGSAPVLAYHRRRRPLPIIPILSAENSGYILSLAPASRTNEIYPINRRNPLHRAEVHDPDFDGDYENGKYCSICKRGDTPLWRNGPHGPKTLCNACGIRFKKREKRALRITEAFPRPRDGIRKPF
ncbi:hypothetical protein NE237_010618 [Protea cynaroides]|uniref:GATA-type domain-containing protein n=1 Tax=Protea cynaroides TaxID=273540 RepID=A0A9Q0KZP6_9MAGN|nr:hypothetical protein NE237_010618 [Protea cynaroides]